MTDLTEPGRAGGIGDRSARALRWNYLGNGVRALSQFLIGVVLARLLGPAAFGTVALGGLLVGVGMLVSDLGFGVVLVQRPRLTEDEVRFVATVQVATGALLSALGVAAAPLVAAWFQAPEATPVIRAMSSMFLLQSFGLTPLALLRRELDFRGAQTVAVTSYLAGYLGVGVPLALGGAGAWSLAAAQIVQSALSSVLALRRRPTPVRPLFRPPSPALFAFGARVIGTNLTNWGLSNADGVAVGRLIGPVALGTYGRAMALVLSPLGALTSSMQGVLFAACSRAQADLQLVRGAYLGATSAVAAATLPLFVTVAAVPEAVVGGVYGPRWVEAAPILTPLALAMPVVALLSMVGPVMTALGRVDVELRLSVGSLLAFGLALAVAGRHSAAAVAWTFLGAQLLRGGLLVHALGPLVGTSWPEVLSSLRWPAGWAIATAAVTAALDRSLATLGVAGPARLAADVLAAALCLLTALRWLGRRWLEGLRGSLVEVEGRLPRVARRWLRV